jgi:multidrug efflux system membrane fusion protein
MPPRPPIPVRTVLAEVRDTPLVINAFGSTEDRLSLDVVPQVSGLLVKTFIADGAVVAEGQQLFQIDPRDHEANVKKAEGVLTANRAVLELSRLTLERTRPLLEKKLVSTEDFDVLQTKAAAAAAQVQVDEATLEQARLNLSRCTITAPWAGVCSKRLVDDGNLVIVGVTRLINIRSYDPLVVQFTVSEQYLQQLRAAKAAGVVPLEIRPRGDTNVYAGTLEFVDNAVNQQSGTILLRGQVPNPGLKLWAGQFAEIRAQVGLARGAVMVPEAAVQFGKAGSYLFVVNAESKAEMRLVETGVRHNNSIEIVKNVAGAESVVVLGQLMLQPGAAVMDPARQAPAEAPAPAEK